VQLHREWVLFEGKHHTALVVRPVAATLPLPAVIVAQEAWGIDEHILDVVARFAAAGYVVVAPDLYWQDGGRPAPLVAGRVALAKRFMDSLPPGTWGEPARREAALADLPMAERAPLSNTLDAIFAGTRDLDPQLAILREAYAFIRESAVAEGRAIGAVGFCRGGALVGLLAAAEPRLHAGVMFYGSPPPAERRSAIRCPLLGLYGGADEAITTQIPEFSASLGAAGVEFEDVVYSGAPHAFFNDTRVSYRVEAARDAWARTLGFLARHLAT
jgi:carboxymethylenebutenolidase